MLPLRHRGCVIDREQATAREDALHPPAHLRLGDGVRIESAGGMEDDPARGRGVSLNLDCARPHAFVHHPQDYAQRSAAP